MMGNRRRPADQRAEMQQIRKKAADLDLVRQKQIENQVGSINRLLTDGSYDAEMQALHRQLAQAQADLESAQEELAALKGARAPVHNLGAV